MKTCRRRHIEIKRHCSLLYRNDPDSDNAEMLVSTGERNRRSGRRETISTIMNEVSKPGHYLTYQAVESAAGFFQWALKGCRCLSAYRPYFH